MNLIRPRHPETSDSVDMGYTELIIAKLLGHVPPGITARHANPNNDALRPAADRIAGVLAAHFDRKVGGRRGAVCCFSQSSNRVFEAGRARHLFAAPPALCRVPITVAGFAVVGLTLLLAASDV